MLNLSEIASRVDKGLGTPADAHMMLEELQRLYGEPSSAEVLQQEQAETAQALAEAEAKRAAESAATAAATFAAAAQRAAAAKAVSDALQKKAADEVAAERAAHDKALAEAALVERKQAGLSLKSILDAATEAIGGKAE